jgi:ATP-binding cassette subfamily F protein uup
MLARALAKPSNVLVLDEPTNDLDLETLDVLEEMLSDYPGTVILISHDRDFLDRVVTSVIVPEGNGKWQEYAGGYSDMLVQRGADLKREHAAAAAAAADEKKAAKPAATDEAAAGPATAKKPAARKAAAKKTAAKKAPAKKTSVTKTGVTKAAVKKTAAKSPAAPNAPAVNKATAKPSKAG